MFSVSGNLYAQQAQFRAIAIPAPAYPASELKAGHEGTVRVLVTINSDGSVASATTEKSSGWPKLDAAALESVKKGRFLPATDQDGKAVAASGVIPITFDSPHETTDSQRAYLETYLSAPCEKYLAILKAEQVKEPAKPEHLQYTFKWPLFLSAELLRAEGKSSKADRLIARDREVYDKLIANCAANPSSTTYTQFNLAIKQAL